MAKSLLVHISLRYQHPAVPAAGPVWAPESCVLVTPSGKLPSVDSRGDGLNGTAYPSVETADAFRGSSGSSGCSSFDAVDSNGSSGNSNGSSASRSGNVNGASSSSEVLAVGTLIGAARGVTLRHDPSPDWLQYGGKWGSTVQVKNAVLYISLAYTTTHWLGVAI